VELLEDKQIDSELAGSDWLRDGSQIKLSLSFKDFMQAVSFINQLSELAESENHHPDILLHSYNQVQVMFSTHSAGGVTDIDTRLANLVTKLVNS